MPLFEELSLELVALQLLRHLLKLSGHAELHAHRDKLHVMVADQSQESGLIFQESHQPLAMHQAQARILLQISVHPQESSDDTLWLPLLKPGTNEILSAVEERSCVGFDNANFLEHAVDHEEYSYSEQVMRLVKLYDHTAIMLHRAKSNYAVKK